MILVTGGTGHIGNVLVRELHDRGEQVRVLALPGEDLAPLQGLPVETIVGDVLDPASLERALRDVTIVYHLAGVISILPGENIRVRDVNVTGTGNVIRAVRQAGRCRLVYTSSIHAIRCVPHGLQVDESQPFDPSNPRGAYDRSKAEASLAVLQAARQGLDAVIVCPTGVIGPFDYRRSEMGQLLIDCMERKPQLFVNGAYDFVDVRDVARGLILAGERGRSGEAYILSGEQISVAGLIETVQQIAGVRTPRLRLPFGLARFAARFTPLYYHLTRTRPLFTPYSLETLASNSRISCAKARQELGYTARPVRESLEDAVRWFTETRLSQGKVKVRA